jgi:hypothetical protein
MQSFLFDLWHDLREKRLAPVALLLLAATAAIPFVLLKKADPAPPAAPTTQAPAKDASVNLPVVALDAGTDHVPSNLQAFNSRNPFKPLKDLPKVDKPAKAGSNKTITLGKSSSGSSSSSSSKTSGGTSGSSGSTAGSSGSSSGSSGSTGSGAGSYTGPHVTYYTYRADIRFGKPGHEKTIKQVATFSLLGGDSKNPAAMYMGITDDNGSAVFAIDSSLYDAAGEGDCKPADDNCQFVYLKPGDTTDETTITSKDGSETYNLQLVDIKRVTLDSKTVESTPATPSKGKATGKAKDKTKTAAPLPLTLFDVLAKHQ